MKLNEMKEGTLCLLDGREPKKVRIIENVVKKVKVQLTENPEIVSPREWWASGECEVLKIY